MSDDLNSKIKQITDILGQENMPDNLKGLLSLLTGPSGAKQEPSADMAQLPSAKEEQSGRNELDENLEMIRKVKKLMDRVSTTHDPRVNLLTAIRPFLNTTRQKKLNGCIQLLQMSSLAKFVDGSDK
jgi:hypothetical protein